MTEPKAIQLAGSSPKPPAWLSEARRRLWRSIVGDYDLGPHELELLRLACEALDRADEARKAIALDGAYLRDRYGGLKAHPATAVERDARVGAVRLFRELSLPVEEPLGPMALGRRRGGGRH